MSILAVVSPGISKTSIARVFNSTTVKLITLVSVVPITTGAAKSVPVSATSTLKDAPVPNKVGADQFTVNPGFAILVSSNTTVEPFTGLLMVIPS